MTGPIEVGERVSCQGSNDATLISIGSDGSYSIQLHPYETVKRYKNLQSSKMVRFQPDLAEYNRAERLDAVPDNDKRLIKGFFLRKLPESPNKKDIVKLRHPMIYTQLKCWPSEQYIDMRHTMNCGLAFASTIPTCTKGTRIRIGPTLHQRFSETMYRSKSRRLTTLGAAVLNVKA